MKLPLFMAMLLPASSLFAGEATDAGFERTVAAHLGEGNPYAARQNYQAGVGYYEQGQYAEALTHFRQAAIADPETPHLAAYMIHAEHEAEREEAARLGAEKEAEFDHQMAEGRSDLAKGHFPEAEAALKKALEIKPGNAEAQSLLEQAQDEPLAKCLESARKRAAPTDGKESERLADRASAQRHYKAGLVAYAKHDLKEARKEWALTARLDSHHPKVLQAIHRVDQELALGSNSNP